MPFWNNCWRPDEKPEGSLMIKYLWATELCPVVSLLTILRIFIVGSWYIYMQRHSCQHEEDGTTLNVNSCLLGILNRGWNLKVMTPKSMLQVENYILFSLRGGENPKFTMQYMLLSLCLGFLFGYSKSQCPSDQLFNISSHWVQADSSKRLCRPRSAAPSRMTLTSVAGLQGCSLSNAENRCSAIWTGLAVVKTFI